MTHSKQEQSAGDYSTQIQAGTIQNTYITNVSGVDEARARRICREEYAIAKQNWTIEANAIAEQRVHELEDRLMPKMIQYDASLSAFADPAFQITLMKAQIAAASTERENDYEVLSELLVHRVENGKDRERCLGITKAIEIVDQIDAVALTAMSLIYAITKFYPISNKLDEGLQTLDSLYGKILAGQTLPSGTGWMDHLDLLSAIRLGVSNLSKVKKFEDYIPSFLDKYFRKGIQEGGEEHKMIKEKLESISVKSGVFNPNPLKEGYLVLAISYDVSQIVRTVSSNGSVTHLSLKDDEKSVMQEVIDIMKSHDLPDQEMISLFWNKWDAYPNLQIIHKWWNELPIYFDFTPMGIALSNAYIHGVDNTVPCMY